MRKNKRKKVLFIATVDFHIYYFHLPYLNLLKKLDCDVEVAANDTGFSQRIEKLGYKFIKMNFNKNPINYKNILSFLFLIKILKKNKYDLIHTHTPIASFIVRICAKLTGINKVIYTVHGFHFHEYGNKIKNLIFFLLEKFASRYHSVLITINKDDYDFALMKNMAPKGKVYYVKGVGLDINLIDKEIFRIENLRSEKRLILFTVGRLEKDKKFDDLFKILHILDSKNIDFKLFIAGDGPLKNYLINYAKNLNLKDKILFLGFIERENVYKNLYLSDIYVSTSIREGLPVSIMEAMALKKPVIAYNIRGVRDLVIDGVNGFLIKVGNYNDFAEKIIYLMNNENLRFEMGEKSRELIENEFSLNKVLPEYEKIYREVLGLK